jgi:hypothetical protein
MLRSVGVLASRIVSEQLAVGAAVLLVCLFVVVDAIGRLVLRNADPRMRGGTSE